MRFRERFQCLGGDDLTNEEIRRMIRGLVRNATREFPSPKRSTVIIKATLQSNGKPYPIYLIVLKKRRMDVITVLDGESLTTWKENYGLF